jgi:hypothetical protein
MSASPTPERPGSVSGPPLLAALTAFLAPTGPEFPHERRPAGY